MDAPRICRRAGGSRRLLYTTSGVRRCPVCSREFDERFQVLAPPLEEVFDTVECALRAAQGRERGIPPDRGVVTAPLLRREPPPTRPQRSRGFFRAMPAAVALPGMFVAALALVAAGTAASVYLWGRSLGGRAQLASPSTIESSNSALPSVPAAIEPSRPTRRAPVAKNTARLPVRYSIRRSAAGEPSHSSGHSHSVAHAHTAPSARQVARPSGERPVHLHPILKSPLSAPAAPSHPVLAPVPPQTTPAPEPSTPAASTQTSTFSQEQTSTRRHPKRSVNAKAKRRGETHDKTHEKKNAQSNEQAGGKKDGGKGGSPPASKGAHEDKGQDAGGGGDKGKAKGKGKH